MPTNKTPFTFNIENEYLEKMRFIAKRETRSLSNLLEHLCKLYIEKYEQEKGEIEIENVRDADWSVEGDKTKGAQFGNSW